MATKTKIPKKSLLPIDELNTLCQHIESAAYVDKNGVHKYRIPFGDLEDEMFELFLLAVAMGETSANDDLDTEASVSADKAGEIVNKEISGKTWKDRVKSYLDNGGTPEEIIRVADTEMMRDFNEGAFETAMASGKNLKKKWIAIMDEATRDTHAVLNGTVVDMDERFYSYSGDSALFPGDFSTAEENCNCRCGVVYMEA